MRCRGNRNDCHWSCGVGGGADVRGEAGGMDNGAKRKGDTNGVVGGVGVTESETREMGG